MTHPSGRAFRRGQAPVAILALTGVVLFAAFGVMDISVLSLIAVASLLILRCIDSYEAWGSIDGSILVLIFSMLIVGKGLQNTGALSLFVESIGLSLSVMHPLIALFCIYMLTSLLTEMISNNAIAVVLTPIVIALATQMGLDPRGFVVAVMMGASASFATPIGYQTNTLVYGAGNYRFVDFLKVGVPMNLLVGIATTLSIYLFFPLKAAAAK